ncbi:MAG: class IV adenylate cyclase [Phycisphaerae bacterium]
MPLEIEGKFRVDSHDAVRRRLAEVGAARVGAVLECNHIFDRPDGSLALADCGLRVRTMTALDGTSRTATLTFKGPRQPGPFKTREEIETTVGEAEAACAILGSLGFVEAVSYEKRRETWRLGDCEVELDELPHLGRYVEIEGPDEAAVHRARESLGLSGAGFIRETYIALVLRHCRERGLPGRLTFDRDRGG